MKTINDFAKCNAKTLKNFLAAKSGDLIKEEKIEELVGQNVQINGTDCDNTFNGDNKLIRQVKMYGDNFQVEYNIVAVKYGDEYIDTLNESSVTACYQSSLGEEFDELFASLIELFTSAISELVLKNMRIMCFRDCNGMELFDTGSDRVLSETITMHLSINDDVIANMTEQERRTVLNEARIKAIAASIDNEQGLGLTEVSLGEFNVVVTWRAN